MSPKWKLNLGSRTKKKCPFSMNRGVPSIEVKDTKIVGTFFRNQMLCLLNGGVPCIQVS